MGSSNKTLNNLCNDIFDEPIFGTQTYEERKEAKSRKADADDILWFNRRINEELDKHGKPQRYFPPDI